MKRISINFVARLACATLTITGTAFAVNPSQTGTSSNNLNYNTNNTPQNLSPYSPMLLPGQEYYGSSQNQDPLFSRDLYSNIPSYPGVIPPANKNGNVLPGPNQGNTTQPSGRTRDPLQASPLWVAPGQNPTTTGPRKWRLGVYSKDTDTGVKIADVVQGAAAHRAGLEVNDVIVAVNGFQVGYVNGQLYDCGSEFERLADTNGWVTLLVQNNRGGGLLNVPVQLDSRMSTLRGSIALPNRQNLPNNAVVNVELREAYAPNSQPVTFASTQINRFTSYPIPFEIEFDPAHVSQNGRYVVFANVVSNNREIYRIPQPQQVLNQYGEIRPVALQLEQVAQTPNYTPRPGYPTQDSQAAQITRWFNEYLGRNPRDPEMQAYLARLREGATMGQVQLWILGSDQFFHRCNSDERVYINQLHQLVLGQGATQDQMNYWLSRYHANNGLRYELAREFGEAIGIW